MKDRLTMPNDGISALTLSDTSANIRSILFSETASIINSRDYIQSLNATDSESKLELSWSEFASLVTNNSSNFNATNSSTWAPSLSNISLSDLNNFEIVVYGTADELKVLVDQYSTELDQLPSGLSFRLSFSKGIRATETLAFITNAQHQST